MKQKIIRLLATLSLLAVLCVSLASCGASDPFDVYWQYLNGTNSKSDGYMVDQTVQVVAQATVDTESQEPRIVWKAAYVQSYSESIGIIYAIDMEMNGSDGEYEFTYLAGYISTTTGEPLQMMVGASGTVTASEFNGNELLEFSEYDGSVMNESADRQTATTLMTALMVGMEDMLAKAELSAEDFGFDIAKEDGSADVDASQNAEEDLGGAFSGARWKYAGKMTLLGMGMVFLVLAILWGVLVIFEKCLYRPNKPAKPAKADPVPATPAVESAPAAPAATDDGVLLAVITAAVAAAMEEEGTPSNGFRVVSFKKTTGRGGPWNG